MFVHVTDSGNGDDVHNLHFSYRVCIRLHVGMPSEIESAIARNSSGYVMYLI